MDSIPFGYCHCGCGMKTKISKRNYYGKKHIKGMPVFYIQGHSGGPRFGAEHHSWKGGITGHFGYVTMRVPDHPRSRNGYVFEHILVAEKILGRHLPPGACVHNINKDKKDNRPENLVICESNSYHQLLHRRMRKFIERMVTRTR